MKNINSIVVFGSDKCCGCTACYSVCPKHCITMSTDKEGFLYPLVNNERCIECEQCIKVCPFHNPFEQSRPKDVYAAINKAEPVRLNSSSGGIFSSMSERIIKAGGVVFGAKFTENWQVEIVSTETIEGLSAFRGSKYLQAKVSDSFKKAKEYLQEGRLVLFSGTPCQIAGLKHFLKKDYPNLLALDFVCHGVPSPKVWSKYLDEVANVSKRAITDIKFRNNSKGWKRYNFSLGYNKREKIYSLNTFYGNNHYMWAFLSDLILRPSCYNCKAKAGRSKSDITIADFWGIENIDPAFDDDKGTSLLLIHTEKGLKALDVTKIEYKEEEYENALRYNPSIERNATPHKHRKAFFDKLDNCKSIIRLMDKELSPGLYQTVRSFYHRCRGKMKTIILRLLGENKQDNLSSHQASSHTKVPLGKGDYKIQEVRFRSKEHGWKRYEVKILIGQ